ncbi:MAG: hypothetical protein K2H52_05785 [Lachnospiraceae bacterium]|nr:hypothetical protein [Lachnospiraceae bacterium]
MSVSVKGDKDAVSSGIEETVCESFASVSAADMGVMLRSGADTSEESAMQPVRPRLAMRNSSK